MWFCSKKKWPTSGVLKWFVFPQRVSVRPGNCSLHADYVFSFFSIFCFVLIVFSCCLSFVFFVCDLSVPCSETSDGSRKQRCPLLLFISLDSRRENPPGVNTTVQPVKGNKQEPQSEGSRHNPHVSFVFHRFMHLTIVRTCRWSTGALTRSLAVQACFISPRQKYGRAQNHMLCAVSGNQRVITTCHSDRTTERGA